MSDIDPKMVRAVANAISSNECRRYEDGLEHSADECPTALAAIAAAAPFIEARTRWATLREAVAVIVDAAPSLNAELRYDGSADPGMSAYVEGFHDACAAVNALLPAAKDAS